MHWALGWWIPINPLSARGQPALAPGLTQRQPQDSPSNREKTAENLPPILLTPSRSRDGENAHRITSVKGTTEPTSLVCSPSYTTTLLWCWWQQTKEECRTHPNWYRLDHL